MGVERLHKFLQHHGRVSLDSCVFVYQLEANPKYLPLAHHVFEWLEAPAHRAITSTVTMTELLVQPYREQDVRRVDDCFGLLSRFPHLDWVAPDLAIADLATRIRAEYRLKTPDALQAATAISMKTTAFISNDPLFRRVKELDTLILDENFFDGA